MVVYCNQKSRYISTFESLVVLVGSTKSFDEDPYIADLHLDLFPFILHFVGN